MKRDVRFSRFGLSNSAGSPFSGGAAEEYKKSSLPYGMLSEGICVVVPEPVWF